MDSRKPLTERERQEIGVLLYRAGFGTTNGGTVDETDVADMHRTCRRLLSLLTPPTDAAVREADEWMAASWTARLFPSAVIDCWRTLMVAYREKHDEAAALRAVQAGAEAQLASREQGLLDTLNRLVDERGTLWLKLTRTTIRL